MGGGGRRENVVFVVLVRAERQVTAIPNDLLHHPVQVPAVGDALQLVLACVLELEAGPGHQVLHGLRGDDLRSACQRRHPGADIDGDPADLVADLLWSDGRDRRDRAVDRAGGPVEVAKNPSPAVSISVPR